MTKTVVYTCDRCREEQRHSLWGALQVLTDDVPRSEIDLCVQCFHAVRDEIRQYHAHKEINEKEW